MERNDFSHCINRRSPSNPNSMGHRSLEIVQLFTVTWMGTKENNRG